MKWKKYNESSEANEPVKIKTIEEIPPEDGFGNLGGDARFLIDDYLNDLARFPPYHNGHIPEDEEEEIRNALVAVYVEFEYWMPEDDEYDAGYEDGKMMLIIDNDDGALCNIDFFEGDYDWDVKNFVKAEAYKYLGLKEGTNCCPSHDD